MSIHFTIYLLLYSRSIYTHYPFTTLFRSLSKGCSRPTPRCVSWTGQARASATPEGATRCCSSSSKRSRGRSEEHTSELQSPCNLVCRLLLEKKNHRSKYRT